MLRWSLKSLALGVYPDERHDGKPWRETDGERAARAGQEGRDMRGGGSSTAMTHDEEGWNEAEG
eukprot:5596861-Pyramimonas_sp.AAC.1